MLLGSVFSLLVIAVSCSKSDTGTATTPVVVDPYAAIKVAFGTNVDPNNLINYAGQGKPAYINKDNTGANPITNAKATLGRVLFYDKNLSIDNTISCGSCHKQQFAFSDTATASKGVAGVLGKSVTVVHNSECFGQERRLTTNSAACRSSFARAPNRSNDARQRPQSERA